MNEPNAIRELSSQFPTGPQGTVVSSRLSRPNNATHLLVLGHGAGAPMTHPWIDALCSALGHEGIASFRYNFPYMEEKRGRPDHHPVLEATVAAAISAGSAAAPDLPLLAGGKSLGGRMTSRAAATGSLSKVRGLVFFGFPLHPPGKPGTERADHLRNVSLPMLFLQGTRDKLADLTLLRPVCRELGPRATLHIVETADHGFKVLRRTGRTDAEAVAELARTTARWARSIAK